MITYLFGAGASRNAIPIVNDLRKSIIEEKQLLQKEFVINNEYVDINKEPFHTQSIFDELIKDFEWLVENCDNDQSIDTLAKKLSIRGEFENLKKLKTILSVYFMIIQSKKKVDIRYDTFFASLLQTSHLPLPSNLRILTWNYDYQLEKAYAEYSTDYRFESCQTLLNIYSKNSRDTGFNTDRFGIVKLNGTASLMLDLEKSNPYNMVGNTNTQYSATLIQTFLKHYASLHHVGKTKEKLIPSLSFAWEDYPSETGAIENAMKCTAETETLVVIGYSFPLFNRFVDRDIIGSMKNLKTVYFQAPDADDLKERFLAIRTDIKDENLKIRKDVNQFVFPNEF